MGARAAILAAILTIGGLGVLLASARPVAASCVVWGTEEEMLAGADSVLVGRVVATTNSDRWATVEVAEVWKGPGLPSVVEVRGGEGPGVGSSVDRTYVAGTRYLFAVSVRDGLLVDNSCSMTRSWDDDFIAWRPGDARPPQDAPTTPSNAADGNADLGPLVAVVLSVGLVGALVFGAVFGLSRRR